METKICSICKCEKEITAFSKRKSGLLRSDCADCCRQRFKNWKEKNPEIYLERIRKHTSEFRQKRKDLIAFFNHRKIEKGCACCGYKKYAECLQFHHIDHSEKKYNIATMITNVFAREEIIVETGKCIVVCANCHAILHAEKQNAL